MKGREKGIGKGMWEGWDRKKGGGTRREARKGKRQHEGRGEIR